MKLISPKQAAEMLGVTIYTLRNWNIAKKLVAIKTMGGHRRYKLEDIKRIIYERES
jgi:excisionase family DNA binding protein